MSRFSDKFIDYSLDVFPYFLIASVIGALIQSYISFSFIRRFINKRFFSPLITAVFGSSVPVCSCSMIPVAQTINSFSKSYAPALSFLIAAPVLSPVILFLMVGMFGWKLTLFRFAVVMIIALSVSYIVDVFFKKTPAIPVFSSGKKPKSKWEVFKDSFQDIFINTGKYVLFGLFIAAVVSAIIPSEYVASFSGFPLSYLFISILSIPVYVCSGEEIPIAKSFVDLGLGYGQALTFMLSSAGICIPTITATLKIFPKSIVVIYVFSWFSGSILSGIIYDLLF
ncbi:permease [Persephonella sp.]